MDWISGMQRAIDYIEEHLTEEIDPEAVAGQCFSSGYHFQRVFSILCGYTLGEYIRSRRLSLAGAELQAGRAKVIDVALKYGYDSPDSFAKAFRNFHGIAPSRARGKGAVLRSFSRLSIHVTLEGGNTMNYRIEDKVAMTLTVCTQRFSGAPSDRYTQEHDFMVKGETRFLRYALQGMAKNCTVEYGVVSDIRDDGYSFSIGTAIPRYFTEHLEKTVGEANARQLEVLPIPAGKYLVVQTERSAFSINEHLDVRKRAVSEWFPGAGWQLSEAPEITVFHSDPANSNNSYTELWLPIEPC